MALVTGQSPDMLQEVRDGFEGERRRERLGSLLTDRDDNLILAREIPVIEPVERPASVTMSAIEVPAKPSLVNRVRAASTICLRRASR